MMCDNAIKYEFINEFNFFIEYEKWIATTNTTTNSET